MSTDSASMPRPVLITGAAGFIGIFADTNRFRRVIEAVKKNFHKNKISKYCRLNQRLKIESNNGFVNKLRKTGRESESAINKALMIKYSNRC